MTWLKRVLPAVALSSLLTSPTFAQITGHPFELSAGGGIFAYDIRSGFKDGPALQGSAGWRLAHWATLEGRAIYGSTETSGSPALDAKFLFVGLGIRFNLRPADGQVVPFLIPEFGYARSEITGAPQVVLERGAPSLGAGALFSLFGNQRLYARLQVSDVMFRERDSFEFSHHAAAVAAVHYVLGGRPKDADLDRVRDWLDRCPETPIGATVDASGCPRDSDRDSVYDGVDTCAATPIGCIVNRSGCPLDADGDGVCDGLDSCATTVAGARVDSKGCPLDSDGDGIFDGLDQCEGTPTGAKIDEKGCPLDADSDGVADGLDKCEGTPAGAQVDSTGCETAASRLEGELLDTGRLRLTGIQFQEDGVMLMPESIAPVDAAGEVLSKWPELKVEIGVHTSGRGNARTNLRLSRERAEAIRSNVLQKYPSLTADNLVAKGYGDTRPLVAGSSEQARSLNQRIELVVLNKSALVQAGGKRRLGGR